MEHAGVVVQRMLITRDEPAEILEPRKEPFDLPPAAIATQGQTILGQLSAVPTMRRDHLDTGLRKFSIQLVGVVGIVTNQTLDWFLHEDLRQRLLHQRHFMRRGALRVNGDRKTMTVGHCHDLGPLASFGFADAGTPFFAGAKLPSMNASSRLNPPRLCKYSASASSTPRITPERTHC